MKRSITIMQRHGTCSTDISSLSPGRVCTQAVFSYAVLGLIHHRLTIAGGPLQTGHSRCTTGSLAWQPWSAPLRVLDDKPLRPQGSRYLKFASGAPAP